MGEELARQQVAGVAEEGQFIHVRSGEDVGAIVARPPVIGAGVARILEADVGIEPVGKVSLGGLILVA